MTRVHLTPHEDGTLRVARSENGLRVDVGFCVSLGRVWFAFDVLGNQVDHGGLTHLYGSLHGAARAVVRHDSATAFVSMRLEDMGELLAGRRDV